MNNLMKAEKYKLLRNKTFWALLGSIIGLSVLLHFLILIEWWQLTGTEFDQAGLGVFNALSVFTVPLFFNLIVSTLAGFYISTEFSQSNVIKNQMLSGNKRTHIFIAKYLVFTIGAMIVSILIPLVTAIVLVISFGQGEIFTPANLMYLGRAYGLFALQFLSFTAIVLLIAIVTEDSGKTILFTLLLCIVMFAIEKLVSIPVINMVYENTFFYQFSAAFNHTLTSGEMIKSILTGVVSFIVFTLCGVYMMNRKEIK